MESDGYTHRFSNKGLFQVRYEPLAVHASQKSDREVLVLLIFTFFIETSKILLNSDPSEQEIPLKLND